MTIVDLRSTSNTAEFAHVGPVFIGLYFSWPSALLLNAMRGAQAEHLRAHKRVYSLAIVPDFGLHATSAPPQDSYARDNIVDLSAATGAQFEAATVTNAMVILPKGMVGVMIRTFMAAMLLHPRMRSKLTISSSLSDAEACFRRVPDGPTVPDDLAWQIESWLREKRARISSQATP